MTEEPTESPRRSLWDVQVWIRVIATMCVLLVCLFVNCVSQVLIERYYLSFALQAPLYDLGFEFLFFLAYPRIPDYMLTAFLLCIFGPLLIWHPKRFQIVRRCMCLMSAVYLSRSFTIIATILPNPQRSCKTDPIAGTDQEVILVEALKVLIGRRVTCGDCLFSGHTAMICLASLVGLRYGRYFFSNLKVWKLIRVLLFLYTFSAYLLIICTRFHYTIDVVLGVLIPTALWKWFHSHVKYINELPSWHPIVWLEFDIRELSAISAELHSVSIAGPHDEEAVALKAEKDNGTPHFAMTDEPVDQLDDPDAPFAIDLKF